MTTPRLRLRLRPALAAAVAAAALAAGCATTPPAAPPAELATLYDFQIVDPADGAVLSLDQAADRLARADVVFLGEFHNNNAAHLAQLRLFEALHARHPLVSLSLEQFERDTQPVLDSYLAGEIGEATLKADGRAWANYDGSYRPLVAYAKANGLPVIAAEAPTWIVRCVGRLGPEALDRLDADARAWAAADLDLSDGPYKDKFIGFMSGAGAHGAAAGDGDGPSAAVVRSYAAQVVRDETMAESIFDHLQAAPGRRVVHLNGSFHSDGGLGTPERLAARAPDLTIAVVSPVAAGDDVTPAGDLVLVVPASPEAYASEDEHMAAMRAAMATRSDRSCPLEGS